MKWIRQFARSRPKPSNYAEKTLNAYRLGIKARGAIHGVRVLVGADSCPACAALAEAVYLPDDAPLLPLAACSHSQGCRCAYAPVMKSDPANSQPTGSQATPPKPLSEDPARA